MPRPELADQEAAFGAVVRDLVAACAELHEEVERLDAEFPLLSERPCLYVIEGGQGDA